jgi:Ca-activated chloride channel family protein
MRTILLAAVLVVSVAAQEPTFHSASSELVVLPVVVSAKHGSYVSDLPRERFAVFDNGTRVAIDFFSNQDTPVTIGLVIDASGSMAPKIGEVVAGAVSFARLSNPDDELFAIQFNDVVSDLTPERAFIPVADEAGLAATLRQIRTEGRTALYDALDAALARLDGGARPRKALVLISDGGDNASRNTLDTVLARARRSNAAIYTIGLFDDADPDRNPRVLKELSAATGGERFLPESAGPLLAACAHIAREIRSGYTIGYAPPSRDGAFHRVRVLLDPPDPRGLEVRTRPGYFAGR